MKRVKLPKGGVQTQQTRPELTPGVPWVGYVHPSHIKPNPKQPREEFFEDAQQELADSQSAVGQIRPISVVPLEDPKNPDIWFMIHDGERSWRSHVALQSEAILVLYNPVINLDDIDFLSFVANFGGRGGRYPKSKTPFIRNLIIHSELSSSKWQGCHTKRCMYSMSIVVVNRFIYLSNQFTKCFKSVRVTKIHLKAFIERLLISILPRTSRMTHGLKYSKGLYERSIIFRYFCYSL